MRNERGVSTSESPAHHLVRAEDADLHAVGLAMVRQFTGVRVTAEQVDSLEVAHAVTEGR